MDNKIYGFIGVESFEIVHLMGAALQELGYKLSVVDYSPFADLMYTIPGYNGGNLDAEYNGIQFYRNATLEVVEEDEFIVLYFGMNLNHPLIRECDELWIYTNSYLHNIAAISNIKIAGEQARFLVFRDRQLTRATKQLVMEELACLNVNDSNFIELDDDTATLDIQFRCQYDSKIVMKGVSTSIQDLIATILESDFEVSSTRKALRKVLGKK